MNFGSTAVISEDGRYRYALTRTWDLELPGCTFVALNPSTADELTNDATIRRCMGYARAWGFGMLWVVNLFGLRATDPRELYTAADPVGPRNDEHLRYAPIQMSSRIVVAWGSHGALHGRGDHVLKEILAPHRVWRFGLTANGQPLHPLRLRGDAPLELARAGRPSSRATSSARTPAAPRTCRQRRRHPSTRRPSRTASASATRSRTPSGASGTASPSSTTRSAVAAAGSASRSGCTPASSAPRARMRLLKITARVDASQ